MNRRREQVLMTIAYNAQIAHMNPGAAPRLSTDSSNIAVDAIFAQNVKCQCHPFGLFLKKLSHTE